MITIILFAILILIVVAFVALSTALYFFFSLNNEVHHTYHFPEINLYVQTIAPSFSDYCYILLGNDSILTLSKNTDFIKIHKNDLMGIDLIFKPNIKDTIYLSNSNGSICINKIKYEYVMTDYKDPEFHEYTKGTYNPGYCIKPTFFYIEISDYSLDVYYHEADSVNGIDQMPSKAIPLEAVDSKN